LTAPAPPHEDVARAVRAALAEDVGSGDASAELVPARARARATVVSREDAVLCGRPWFDAVFAELDPAVVVRWRAADGDPIAAGSALCEVEGRARALLAGERSALNFLQLLSGTATLARRYRDAVAGTGVRLLDTRKTAPGLRGAQKYAVRCGGCENHRLGLFDAMLVKENHIAAAGSLEAAVRAARASRPDLPLEVEVESLDELRAALACGVGRVLLDDFDLEALRAAVRDTAGRATLEASGNVTLDNVADIARTGVDAISVGALTKHVRAVDLSMRVTLLDPAPGARI